MPYVAEVGTENWTDATRPTSTATTAATAGGESTVRSPLGICAGSRPAGGGVHPPNARVGATAGWGWAWAVGMRPPRPVWLVVVPVRGGREEPRAARSADAGLVVVPPDAVQRGGLDVDRLEPEHLALRRVQEVREVGTHLGDRLAGSNDVMQGARAQHAVVQRVDEPELVVRPLIGDRHHAGQQRRRQAGAADPVLRPERPVREH